MIENGGSVFASATLRFAGLRRVPPVFLNAFAFTSPNKPGEAERESNSAETGGGAGNRTRVLERCRKGLYMLSRFINITLIYQPTGSNRASFLKSRPPPETFVGTSLLSPLIKPQAFLTRGPRFY